MNQGYAVSKWYRVAMAMTLRIDEELEQALKDLSESEGMSRQEIIKRAVLEKHRRTVRRERLEVITSDLLVEYDDALRRLGTV